MVALPRGSFFFFYYNYIDTFFLGKTHVWRYVGMTAVSMGIGMAIDEISFSCF